MKNIIQINKEIKLLEKIIQEIKNTTNEKLCDIEIINEKKKISFLNTPNNKKYILYLLNNILETEYSILNKDFLFNIEKNEKKINNAEKKNIFEFLHILNNKVENILNNLHNEIFHELTKNPFVIIRLNNDLYYETSPTFRSGGFVFNKNTKNHFYCEE